MQHTCVRSLTLALKLTQTAPVAEDDGDEDEDEDEDGDEDDVPLFARLSQPALPADAGRMGDAQQSGRDQSVGAIHTGEYSAAKKFFCYLIRWVRA